VIVGVPKEIKEDEYRVGLVPAGVRAFRRHGHRVILQRGAGAGCLISDEEYEAVGGEMVSSAEEIYGKAELIVKVKEPLQEEVELLNQGQTLYAYLHLAAMPELTSKLLERKVIGVAYETIQKADGSLPLLIPMSEVAGRMAVQVGAHLLEKSQGGRGVLLGGAPGVTRGRVTILGAGTVGSAAVKIAVGMGANVYVLDVDQLRLEAMDDLYGNKVATLFSHEDNIRFAVGHSHLIVGAVLVPGALTPTLVTRDMVRSMKAGSVIVDVSIDQGGCVETSKPTSHRHPSFTEYGVLHYCVTNMPGAVPRTSTFALTNTTLSYGLKLADQGIASAVRTDPSLAKGVNLWRGNVTHPQVAESLGLKYVTLRSLLPE